MIRDVNLNRGRLAWCAAVAGAAFLAWRGLSGSTRDDLKMRAACAGGALLGNPVAYRVLVLKDGPGPGIEVRGGPSIVSQCTVIGVSGNGFNMFLGDPLDGASDMDGDDDDWDGDDDDQEETDGGEGEVSADEMSPQPNVVPSVCEDGHTSWPGRFLTVRDQSVYTSRTGTRTGTCPECGKPRAILPGQYQSGKDGFVTRAELPA
jgi:hypothetical protein